MDTTVSQELAPQPSSFAAPPPAHPEPGDRTQPPEDRNPQRETVRRRWPVEIVIGLATGLAIGVSARVFMRLVSNDPDFSWSGTIFIVGLFTVFGLLQGVVAAVRSRTARRWITAPVRVLGGVSYLLLGGGAGTLLVPLLWCGGLARWRRTWHRAIRAILAVLAVANLLAVFGYVVSDTGMRPGSVVGLVLLTFTYAAAIHTVGPTLRGRRPSSPSS